MMRERFLDDLCIRCTALDVREISCSIYMQGKRKFILQMDMNTVKFESSMFVVQSLDLESLFAPILLICGDMHVTFYFFFH